LKGINRNNCTYECMIERKLSEFSFQHAFLIVIFCDMIEKPDIGSIAEFSCQKDFIVGGLQFMRF